MSRAVTAVAAFYWLIRHVAALIVLVCILVECYLCVKGLPYNQLGIGFGTSLLFSMATTDYLEKAVRNQAAQFNKLKDAHMELLIWRGVK